MVRTAAWVLVFVALGAAVASWFTPRPDLDAADAVDTAVGAFAEIGLEVSPGAPIERMQHSPAAGDPVAVWAVPVDVDGDEIETRVLVDSGQLVYVDDRVGPDRQERLLTDDQFRAIAEYRNDVTLADWVTRNLAATVAAAIVALVGFVVAKRSDQVWAAPMRASA